MHSVQCTGAVLIGGQSSRMGQPKHKLMINGQPMLDHVVKAMLPLCRQVILLGAAEPGIAYPSIPDLHPGCGPLSGIEAVLASGVDAQYLICPCDLPRVTSKLLAMLLVWSEAPATLFSSEGGSKHPLPLRVSTKLLPRVQQALKATEYSLRKVLESVECETIPISLAEAGLLANVNTPEELGAIGRLDATE